MEIPTCIYSGEELDNFIERANADPPGSWLSAIRLAGKVVNATKNNLRFGEACLSRGGYMTRWETDLDTLAAGDAAEQILAEEILDGGEEYSDRTAHDQVFIKSFVGDEGDEAAEYKAAVNRVSGIIEEHRDAVVLVAVHLMTYDEINIIEARALVQKGKELPECSPV